MELKQEVTQTDLGGSPTNPNSPPPETDKLDMEATQDRNQGIDNGRLQDSLAAVIKQLQELAAIMGRSDLSKDSKTNLHRLRRYVLKLSKFEYPETRVVGLIGNTGVGKSSVINSILGGNSLARTNDDIGACTCVIVEYRALDHRHNQLYTVEVDFMDRNEMKDFLRDHLHNYRQWYFKLEKPKVRRTAGADWERAGSSDISDEEDDAEIAGQEADKLQPDEIVKLQKAQQSARETFKALFKGPDAPTMEDLVQQNSFEAETAILNTLLQKAIEGLSNRPGGKEATQYTGASDGLESCTELLDLLTTDSQGDAPSIWPFVKLIRVYLDSPILKTGLVLADMPGLRDLNYARQEATERYIQRHCHVLGFVTRISRCLSDETIEEVNWKTWTEMPAIVVVTRADEVGGTGNDRGDRHDDQVLRGLDDSIRSVKDEGKRVSSSMKNAESSQKEELVAKWMELSEEESNLAFEKRKIQIQQRNNKTIAKMASMPSRKDMKVFCVGNNDYLENCNGDSEREKACVELSGIPQLRRYFQSIPAEAQMSHVAKFIRIAIPAAISSVELWADGAFNVDEQEKASGISDVLKTVQDGLISEFKPGRGLVASTRVDLEHLFKRRILSAIDEYRVEWEDRCAMLFSGWKQWAHGSFAAACRKHGIHSTQTLGNHNWNTELISPTREKMTNSWEEFMNCLGQQSDRLASEITDRINNICAPFQVENGLPPNSRNGLVNGIQFRKAEIIEHFQHTFEKIFKESKIIRENMTKGKKTKTAFITKYMLRAYQSASAQGGPGSDGRRKTIMEAHITNQQGLNDGGVVGGYYSLSQKAWTQALNLHFKSLQKRVGEVVDSEINDLQAVAAAEGKMPEAVDDRATARDVLEQLRVIRGLLNQAQAVLLEIESNEK